jgi:hypothetical protein
MEAESTQPAGQCRVLRPTVPETGFATKDVEFSWSMVAGAGGNDCYCLEADPNFHFDFE